MYNNEDRIAVKRMHEFSPVDGFLEITEDMADMTKFIANEPSVGLFYVQQHMRNAAPNLINLRNKVSEKSYDTSLHTEDTEDSISSVSSMKECGFPIIEDMIGEIKKSLTVISTKQPKKGLIERTRFLSPSNWVRHSTQYSDRGDEKSGGYLPNVFKSAKLRGHYFKQPQVEEEADHDLLTPSNETVDESQMEKSSSQQKLGALYDSYEEFNAKRESELEEWLGRTDHKEIPGNIEEGSVTGHNLAP